MNESWLAGPIVFRFNIPGIQLFSLKVPGMFLDRHFTALSGDRSLLFMPFEKFPSGVEALWTSSYPVNAPLPWVNFQSGTIGYVPLQYLRRWIELRGTLEEILQKSLSKSRSTLRRKERKFAQLCEREVEELDLRHPGAHPAAIIGMKAAAGRISPGTGSVHEATF